MSPDAHQIRIAREAIHEAQRADRPRGMPPKQGLLYQPVPFSGFEDLGCERNSSESRFQDLVHWLRPSGLRVLDLGCANGFFLFRLAQTPGAISFGMGVDYFGGNVKTANILASTHNLQDRLEFFQRTVDPESVKQSTDEPFDVALLLSVHHHIVRSQSIDAAKEILRRLYDRVGTVIVEQGSLTQAEYEAWTGRDEPFSTRSWSRLVSMGEACGIPADHAFAVSMGRYLSGDRDDMDGSGRVIVGFSKHQMPRRISCIHRKYHRNGITMELLELDGEPGEVWKNVVEGESHHAVRELQALRRLRHEPGFIRVLEDTADGWGSRTGWIRLRRASVQRINEVNIPPDFRDQCLTRLMAMARAGIIHAELHPDHVQVDADAQVVVLDFETARFSEEPFETWFEQVATSNPALGLGGYPRQAIYGDPESLDVIAMDALLARWGLPTLTDSEKQAYHQRLAAGLGA